MRKFLVSGLGLALLACSAFAADDVASAVVATVKTVDKGTKTVVVKTADGTEKTFRVAGHDTAVSAEEIGKGTEKGAKVTVYYTESAGKGVAHFFEKL